MKLDRPANNDSKTLATLSFQAHIEEIRRNTVLIKLS